MRKTYQVTEYGSFVRDKEVLGSTSLPPDTFDALGKTLCCPIAPMMLML